MNLRELERRRDHRTHAFVPIKVLPDEMEDVLAAHLLDLSAGGAGIVTGTDGAPSVGDYLELEFAVPNRSGNEPARHRRETGKVVNIRETGQGLTRVGVRFLHIGGNDAELFDPLDVLSHHRKSMPIEVLGGRRETARHFQGLSRVPVGMY